MILYYVLDGQTPVPEPDIHKWAEWYRRADRRVAKTYIGKVFVSTVFLGIDHSFMDTGIPILFETMVFGGDDSEDREQERYATWDQAVAGHNEIVARIRGYK